FGGASGGGKAAQEVQKVTRAAETAIRSTSRLSRAFQTMGRVAMGAIRGITRMLGRLASAATSALGRISRFLFSFATGGPLAPLLAAAGVGFGAVQIIRYADAWLELGNRLRATARPID